MPPQLCGGTLRWPTTPLFYFLAYFGPSKILKSHGLPVPSFPCFTRDVQVMLLQYYKPCLALRKFSQECFVLLELLIQNSLLQINL